MSLQKHNLLKRNSLKKTKGLFGEQIATSYLTHKGYKIIERNATSRWGEIDIIAQKPEGTVAFIEVKCKTGLRYGKPYESVTFGKLKRLSKTIQFYVLKNHLLHSKLAIEVVSIQLNTDNSIENIQHFENIAIV